MPGIKVGIYFVTFAVFGTMIILSLFIGIIMNSMSEMHAEIAERDRAEHVRETGSATLEDELKLLEKDLKDMQGHMAGLPRKWRSESRPTVTARNMEELVA